MTTIITIVFALIVISVLYVRYRPVSSNQQPVVDERLTTLLLAVDKLTKENKEILARLDKAKRNEERLFNICGGIQKALARPEDPIEFTHISRCLRGSGDQTTTTKKVTYGEVLRWRDGHILLGLQVGESSTNVGGWSTYTRDKTSYR